MKPNENDELTFEFMGEDFSDCIKCDAELEMFLRIKELEKELHKPIAECYLAVIEIDKLRRILKGLPPLKIIPYDGSKISKDPGLN